jgi:phage repressor protein C with HTH and peptisase S24 domain
MHPRYRAGEFVIVEPSKEPPLGEDVVVIFNDGRKMLKVLNWIRDGEVQLLSINNGFAPLTISVLDISAMHYAAGRAPRSALRQE